MLSGIVACLQGVCVLLTCGFSFVTVCTVDMANDVLPPGDRPSNIRIDKMNKNELKACVHKLLASIDKAESVPPDNASDSTHFNHFRAKLDEVLTEVKESRAERALYSQKIQTLESDMITLKEENSYLKSALSNQQRFLEYFDGDKRAHNLIITGVPERASPVHRNPRQGPKHYERCKLSRPGLATGKSGNAVSVISTT